MFLWVSSERANNRTVPGDIIREKALQLANRSGIVNFSASKIGSMLSANDKQNLPVYYEQNGSAWMNAELFSKFLKRFDKHVGRPVLLIMDNASTHALPTKTLV